MQLWLISDENAHETAGYSNIQHKHIIMIKIQTLLLFSSSLRTGPLVLLFVGYAVSVV